MRRAAALLVLACVSCGGQVSGSATVGAPFDAGANSVEPAEVAPPEIEVGDSGVICSLPVASMADANDEGCSLVTSCMGGGIPGLTVEGECFPGGINIRCLSGGIQFATYTSNTTCDCADTAWFVQMAVFCS